MENFIEVKENIMIQAYTNDACEKEVKRAAICESWEQLQEVVADNIWWCIDNDIELPNSHYKSNIYEFTIINGKLDGEYKEWWENGQPYIHCTYKNGELEGEYKMFYENGQLGEHSFFKEGEEHGEYKSWWENGKLSNHFFYQDSEVIEC
jgi:hypothetical protein